MKVSVITTNFNNAQYLEPALKCIQEQATEHEVEHIVWDDCSTVEYEYERLVELSARYHATFYHSRTRLGCGIARNRAIEAFASGNIFVFLDADDYFSHNYIQAMVDACEGIYSPVYPNVQMFGERTDFIVKPEWTKKKATSKPFIPAHALVTREHFAKVGGFRKVQFYEDFDLWVRMAKAGIIGRHCPEATLFYNIRKDSISDHFNLRGTRKRKLRIKHKVRSQ